MTPLKPAVALLTALLLTLSGAVLADTPVRVLDGDTISIAGIKYRLWGIDAPEHRQVCGGGWPAGDQATRFMRSLVEGHTVTCETMPGHDRYGRTIALCRADGVDIQAEMVKAGMAWAFVRYSRDYAQLEAKAVTDSLGIHAHHCDKAWDWRAAHQTEKPAVEQNGAKP